MDTGTFAASCLWGAVIGTGQGLFAVALILTFRSTGFLNLSLGMVASCSAYVMWDLWSTGDVPLVPALLIALAAAVLIGLLVERILRPLRRATVVVRAVSTLGILLILQFAIIEVWGPDERFLGPLAHGGIRVGNIPLSWQQLLTAVIAIGVVAALELWGKTTVSGIATLAVAEDPRSARAIGIRMERVSAGVWGISALLAGATGISLSGYGILNTFEMTLTMVTALAAALVAGFERLSLALVAAATVGALTAGVSSVDVVARVAGLKESLGFLVVLFVIVVLRPQSRVAFLERA